MRQESGVVARTGPDMQHGFACRGAKRRQAARMKTGLTVVDPAVRGKCDKHVLIEKAQIV